MKTIFSILALALTFSSLEAQTVCWHGKYDVRNLNEGLNKYGYSRTGTNSLRDASRYIRSGYQSVVCHVPSNRRISSRNWASTCSKWASKYYRGNLAISRTIPWSTCFNGNVKTFHKKRDGRILVNR